MVLRVATLAATGTGLVAGFLLLFKNVLLYYFSDTDGFTLFLKLLVQENGSTQIRCMEAILFYYLYDFVEKGDRK